MTTQPLPQSVIDQLAQLGYGVTPLDNGAHIVTPTAGGAAAPDPTTAPPAPQTATGLDQGSVSTAVGALPAIVAGVQANPNVPNTPEATSSAVSDVLAALIQQLPAIEAVSRASPRTAAALDIVGVLAGALAKLFVH